MHYQPSPCHVSSTRQKTLLAGHNWKLVKKNCRCDTLFALLFSKGINRWNSLLQEDIDYPSIDSFMNRLEKRHAQQMNFFKDV